MREFADGIVGSFSGFTGFKPALLARIPASRPPPFLMSAEELVDTAGGGGGGGGAPVPGAAVGAEEAVGAAGRYL